MKKTILLVDDDLDLLRSLADMLRGRGYEVLEHSDSGEALECFRRNQDLTHVLTDIDMPGMNGMSLLAEIYRIQPLIEGVLMTGNVEQSSSKWGGGLNCLRKPFSSHELLHALEHQNLIH